MRNWLLGKRQERPSDPNWYIHEVSGATFKTTIKGPCEYWWAEQYMWCANGIGKWSHVTLEKHDERPEGSIDLSEREKIDMELGKIGE